MWIYLGLISSVLLGLYDICKKRSLNHNSVLPVLFLASLSGFIPFALLFIGSRIIPGSMSQWHLYVPLANVTEHLHIFAKSAIISVSWTLAYFAMKHLPISIVSPIRASGPLWTLIGALILFHERPVPMQWLGMGIIFFFYYVFSLLGLREGVVFHRSRWVLYIFLATFIGTFSSLYDKYLLQQMNYSVLLVQFWFSFYLVVCLGLIVAIAWWPRRTQHTPFQWRWSIPMIGLLLVSADVVYFNAVRDQDALIVILSLLRRCSVVVSFGLGSVLFGEVNLRKKAWALLGVLAGVALIVLS